MRAVHDHDLRQHVHTRGNRSTIASDQDYDRRAHHRGHVSGKLAGLLGVSKFPHEQHVHAERRIHPTFYGDYHGNQLQNRNPCPSSSSSSTFSASLSSTFPASLSSTFSASLSSTCPASLLCLHVPRTRALPGVRVPAAPGVLLDTAFCSTVSPQFLLVKGGQESTGSRLTSARKHDGQPGADETCAGNCCSNLSLSSDFSRLRMGCSVGSVMILAHGDRSLLGRDEVQRETFEIDGAFEVSRHDADRGRPGLAGFCVQGNGRLGVDTPRRCTRFSSSSRRAGETVRHRWPPSCRPRRGCARPATA